MQNANDQPNGGGGIQAGQGTGHSTGYSSMMTQATGGNSGISGPVAAVISAAALIAVLLFAIWVSKKVASFFGASGRYDNAMRDMDDKKAAKILAAAAAGSKKYDKETIAAARDHQDLSSSNDYERVGEEIAAGKYSQKQLERMADGDDESLSDGAVFAARDALDAREQERMETERENRLWKRADALGFDSMHEFRRMKEAGETDEQALDRYEENALRKQERKASDARDMGLAR